MGLVSKTFSQIITFTRASTATYYNASGVLTSAAIDAPRFDYNPATLGARGLLIEESRANIVLYSAVGPAGTGWTAVGTSTITYGQTAPDGSTDAVLFNDTDAATVAYMRQQPTVPNDTNTYCFSAFVKQGTSGKFYLRVAFTGGTNTFGTNIFDFATLTWTGGGIFLSSNYQDVGGGWYRVWTTFANNGTGNVNYDVRIGSTTTTVTDTGSVYFWGIQTEVGTFPTSYIPTTTTSLTRSADSATVATLSPWFSAAEGVLFSQANTFDGTTANTAFYLSDGTTANRIQTGHGNGGVRCAVVNGGVSTVSQNPGTYVANATSKVALGYATNNSNSAMNGTLATLDTNCTIPSGINAMRIGGISASNAVVNGWITRLTYYPRRLSDAQLQSITT